MFITGVFLLIQWPSRLDEIWPMTCIQDLPYGLENSVSIRTLWTPYWVLLHHLHQKRWNRRKIMQSVVLLLLLVLWCEKCKQELSWGPAQGSGGAGMEVSSGSFSGFSAYSSCSCSELKSLKLWHQNLFILLPILLFKKASKSSTKELIRLKIWQKLVVYSCFHVKPNQHRWVTVEVL